MGRSLLTCAAALPWLALGLLGCAPASDTYLDVTYDPCGAIVVPDESATNEQLDSIDQALALWNERGGFELQRLRREEQQGRSRLSVRFDASLGVFRGYYDDEAGVVFVNPRLRSGYRAITVAHELGHAFGLFHVEPSERRSVMNPGNLAVGPTAEDVEEVRSLWGRCPAAPDP